MSYEIVFTPAAYEDLQLAFEWYESQRIGLGWEFRYELSIGIEKITDDQVNYQAFIEKSENFRSQDFRISFISSSMNAKSGL